MPLSIESHVSIQKNGVDTKMEDDIVSLWFFSSFPMLPCPTDFMLNYIISDAFEV
jgi:hypothetical protein